MFIRLVNMPIGLSADTNCEKWIWKSLVKEDVIKDIIRAKHMFTHCDLKNIIISIWKDDDPVFIYLNHRV